MNPQEALQAFLALVTPTQVEEPIQTSAEVEAAKAARNEEYRSRAIEMAHTLEAAFDGFSARQMVQIASSLAFSAQGQFMFSRRNHDSAAARNAQESDAAGRNWTPMFETEQSEISSPKENAESALERLSGDMAAYETTLLAAQWLWEKYAAEQVKDGWNVEPPRRREGALRNRCAFDISEEAYIQYADFEDAKFTRERKQKVAHARTAAAMDYQTRTDLIPGRRTSVA